MNKMRTWNNKNITSINRYFRISYFIFLLIGVLIFCIKDFNLTAFSIHLLFFIISSSLLPYSIHFFDYFLEKKHDEINDSNEKEILIFGNYYKNISNNYAEGRELRVYGDHKTKLSRIILNVVYFIAVYFLYIFLETHFNEYHIISGVIGFIILNSKTYHHLYFTVFLQIITIIPVIMKPSILQLILVFFYFLSILYFFMLGSFLEKLQFKNTITNFSFKESLNTFSSVLLPFIFCCFLSYLTFSNLNIDIPNLITHLIPKPDIKKLLKKDKVKLLTENVLNNNILLEKVPIEYIDDVMKFLPKGVEKLEKLQGNINKIEAFKESKDVIQNKKEKVSKEALSFLKNEIRINKQNLEDLNQQISEFQKMNNNIYPNLSLESMANSISKNISKLESIGTRLSTSELEALDFFNMSSEITNINKDLSFSFDQLEGFIGMQNDQFKHLDSIIDDNAETVDFAENIQKFNDGFLNKNFKKKELDKLVNNISDSYKLDSNTKEELLKELNLAKKSLSEKNKITIENKNNLKRVKTEFFKKPINQKLHKINLKSKKVNKNFNKINEYILQKEKKKYMASLTEKIKKNPLQEKFLKTEQENKKNIDIKYDKIPKELIPILNNDESQKKVLSKDDRKSFDFLKFLRISLLFIFLHTIYFFFFKRSKKRIRSEVDQAHFKKLTKQYKYLLSRNLPPKEEVMDSYFLIFTLLNERYFLPINETAPPPSKLNQLWKANDQPMTKSFSVVTETYCELLYGEKQISSKGIKSFRKHFKNIWQSLKKGHENLN